MCTQNRTGKPNSLQNELMLSLKNHIAILESQIIVKDEQLRTQAVHLQPVLTQKAISAPSKAREDRKTASKKETTVEHEIKPAAKKEEDKTAQKEA